MGYTTDTQCFLFVYFSGGGSLGPKSAFACPLSVCIMFAVCIFKEFEVEVCPLGGTCLEPKGVHPTSTATSPYLTTPAAPDWLFLCDGVQVTSKCIVK